MEQNIQHLQQEFLNRIEQATTLSELDEIYLDLFGKQGKITVLPKQFSQLTTEEKRKIGPIFNQAKQMLEEAVERRRQQIKEKFYQDLIKEDNMLKETVIKYRIGHLHPLTQFEQKIVELFSQLGFQQFDAPHIDTDYNNFEVLNIPPGHPARDLWDTLYIDISNLKLENLPGKLLLRTHTSNSQIWIMKQFKPPIRLMTLGRCFRYENLDARHEHTFEQFELVYIDQNLSMANLQYLSEYFLQGVFGEEIKVRLRPKYYPFVEPGVGVDGLCIFCKGKGCKICGEVGWLELAGAGMIHPKVLEAGGIDPKKYTGIAWGFGPNRMVMIQKGIEDIRSFNSADLKFLSQF